MASTTGPTFESFGWAGAVGRDAAATDPFAGGAPYVVHQVESGVEIDGLDVDDAREALALLMAAREVQYELGSSSAAALLRALSVAQVDLSAPALVEQARRQADLRHRLLTTPVFTYAALAKARGDAKQSGTRTWVSRRRERHELFTVTVDGRILIPAFQFDKAGDLRPELAGMLHTMLTAGVEGWPLWTWFTTATPLLSGGIPEQVAATNRQRAEKAASRFAALQRSAA